MTSTLLKYQPPARDGWVFYSNFAAGESGDRRKDVTREFAQYTVASTFEIPIDDVLVEPFHPDGEPTSRHHTAWASYVRDKHAAAVQAKRDYLQMLIQLLDEHI
jgi:hypothetical protein